MSDQKQELEQAIASDTPEATLPDDASGDAGYTESEEVVDSADPLDTPDKSSRKSGLMGKLMNNEPNPELGQIDLDVNEQEGGFARIVRGIGKIVDLDVDKPPAIMDIGLGAYEEAKKQNLFEEANDSVNANANDSGNESESTF